MPENTVTHGETSDTRPNLDDVAREIFAEDEWVLEPGKYEVADDLFDPIEGLMATAWFLDDDLVLAWVGVGREPQVWPASIQAKQQYSLACGLILSLRR